MNKTEFVKKLEKFWCESVEPDRHIKLEYRAEDGEEWVYVHYISGGKKRFCVTADSYKGITKDFIKFLDNHDDYSWLWEED